MSMSEMHVMDPSGHLTVTWDTENPETVRVARETFTEMVGKGYRAFHVEGKDRQGRPMTTFDQSAEELILLPALAGG